MKNALFAFTLAIYTMTGISMADSMITKTSPHSVAETIDRLVAAVEGAGRQSIRPC